MALMKSAWSAVYEYNPILLTGGIAEYIPGGIMPISALVNGIQLVTGGGFATFKPIPGSDIISNKVAEYPFPNQVTAANAVVREPLFVSLLMMIPVQDDGGYLTKLAVISGLKNSIQMHQNMGGLFTVLTPYQTYSDCVLLSFRCIDEGDTKQVGHTYQFDFKQVIVTTDAAEGEYNAMMKKIDGEFAFSNEPSWASAALEML